MTSSQSSGRVFVYMYGHDLLRVSNKAADQGYGVTTLKFVFRRSSCKDSLAVGSSISDAVTMALNCCGRKTHIKKLKYKLNYIKDNVYFYIKFGSLPKAMEPDTVPFTFEFVLTGIQCSWCAFQPE